jgi:phosphate acetyltransferase
MGKIFFSWRFKIMGMFDKLIANLKAEKKTIVFTEGSDARILTAADRLLKEGLMGVILCGNVDEVKAAAAAGNFNIDGAEILDPATYPEMDALVAQMVELRKGKMTEEEVRAALAKSNYFGTMLVKAGKADALLGGATYSTADTVRPALQIIKTKKGSNLVSSSFILFREKDGKEEKIAMGDCAINLSYSDKLDKDGNVVLTAAQQLAEVAVETARTAAFFGIDPKVAVLSFSTYGSGKGGTVQLSHDAVIEARKIDPELTIDGEFQFDAAVSAEVAKTKCPDSKVAGQANTFIFPLIEAGNIGYKIAQRLGGFEAYGPILQGLNAPINDLSRGCNAEEVYKMAIITAGMA